MRDCFSKLILKDNAICVGLDPIIEKMPLEYSKFEPRKAILKFLLEIVKITSKYSSAFKIQKAFIELHGGPELLMEIIKKIHEISPEKPVIVDGKFGDIENTMDAYLKNIFENADADGIVINPFMGEDTFNSLKKYKDRAILVLIRTSNKGASFIQDTEVLNNKNLKIPFWKHILLEILKRFNENKNIIPILSEHANSSDLREILPEDAIVFFAGIGAQNGNISKIRPLLNNQGGGIIVNSSRAILYPYSREDANWREKVLNSVRKMHEQIKCMQGLQKKQRMVLFLGPSGVGKSYIMNKLCKQFPNTYSCIKPYTTRPLRKDEIGKTKVSFDRFKEMTEKGEIVCPNIFYDHHYGPSRKDILKTLNSNLIPILDWPVNKVFQFRNAFPKINIMTIYLTLNDLQQLKIRVMRDKRNKNRLRYKSALSELTSISLGMYEDSINLYFENINDKGVNVMTIHEKINKFYESE